MTMMTRCVPVALCSGLLIVAACAVDEPVLWVQPSPEPIDGQGAASVGSSAGGHSGTSGGVGGAGADGQGPALTGGSSPTPICADDWEPVCECLPGTTCDCGSTKMGPCTMTCTAGECDMRCLGAEPCNTECAYGCSLLCAAGSMCTLGCAGDCTMVCEKGSNCSLWSWDLPSEMYCALGALCECSFADNCNCSGPGCP